ncbi:hypothetical protein EUX98_g4355 [Antrodiella citrinella]|uniref:Uncharacterized protein n=1 Tax=Antrodiella citrinella TaxID=2447956 RepID=A0A4S4MWQ1_9APHY|nr:hypothetical protein EUX98_g4355 [Antrodiella citrinella]
MPRELRKRTSRPNYSILADLEDELDAGPSTSALQVRAEKDASGSESDFAPNDEDIDAQAEEEEEEGDDEEEILYDLEDADASVGRSSADEDPEPTISKNTIRKAAKKSSGKQDSTSKTNANALPSVHHRHRAVPIFRWNGKVERLKERPQLFKEPVIVPTNSWSYNDQAANRIGKSHGLNAGSGPLWELMEDRGWYKESFEWAEDENEAYRRPSVHEDVKVPEDWQILSPRAYKQYLAVAPLPSNSHAYMVGARAQRPAYACIQIWTLSASDSDAGEDEGAGEDSNTDGVVRCEMVLCVESGGARELKWCPLPSHDSYQPNASGSNPCKLGIIAGTFEDGSISLYAVPDPANIRARAQNSANAGPIFVKLSNPLLRLELEDTTLWCLDWANSDIIAAGCANGSIVVYDVGTALREGITGIDEHILPTHYFPVHQSAIQSITWVRAPTVSATGERTADNPTVIATGGYDGLECFSDIRERTGVIMNRTREVVNSVDYSPFYGGPISVGQENTVKAYSLAPVMLGRGHKFMEPNGPVWSIKSSDYHPQIAVGASDGSCHTTNTVRSTRRGGAVAFFVHKIYQLDYSRKTGEYRMLERFLPQETKDRPSATKAKQPIPIGTGAWSPGVGVQRVVWNSGNGLAGAPLLASATGSGLCRIDWLLGRWYKGRVPYVTVEAIRQEVEGEDGMEEDSE